MGSKIKKKFGKSPELKREAPKIKKIAEGVRGIVRIGEADVDGMKKVPYALRKIKGVGHSFSHFVPKLAGVDPNSLMGKLNDEQINKLEEVIRNPLKYGVPKYLVNRKNDPVSGEDKHIIASELLIMKKIDVDKMKKIHSYKGVRHELGLPVRGQRTRGSFRKGTTAGVVKKRPQPSKGKKK